MIFKLILTSFINLTFCYNINRYYTELPLFNDKYNNINENINENNMCHIEKQKNNNITNLNNLNINNLNKYNQFIFLLF